MAHYIAELIEGAQAATGEEHSQKTAACADAILKLWAHRREWPRGHRPLEDFDPVFRALESLEPNVEAPRYFVRVRNALEDRETAPETADWLQIASGLDHTARTLIRYCIAEAIKGIEDCGQDWLTIAKSSVGVGEPDLRVIEIVLRHSSALRDFDPRAEKRRELEGLLTRLNAFASLADQLSSDIRQGIGELNDTAGSGSEVIDDVPVIDHDSNL